MATESDGGSNQPPLEPIDWDAHSAATVPIPWRLVLFAVGLGAISLAFLYSQATGSDVLYRWSPKPLTWVYRVSLLVLLVFGVPALLSDRDRTRRYLSRLRENWIATGSLVVLAGLVVFAQLGPMVMGRPRANPIASYQPPVGFGSPAGVVTINCIGPVVGPPGADSCMGTWAYPLGTGPIGQNMISLLASGLHVSLQVAVITVAIMIPIATGVGIVAGYIGGPVDTVLMRYVDVQQSVPAFVVYIILVFAFGSSLFLLVLVFGLFNWGSIARLVRSETIQRRESQYVDVARGAGVGPLRIIRRHILPNVSNAVVVGATQKIPQLILLETGLTYIELGDVGRRFQSFGQTIERGFAAAFGHGPMDVWWIWVLPVIVLAITVISLSVVGDALRDVLDPRGSKR
ncbi:MAG: ABC transporter permease [Halodesulfurarchaeum sp.]